MKDVLNVVSFAFCFWLFSHSYWELRGWQFLVRDWFLLYPHNWMPWGKSTIHFPWRQFNSTMAGKWEQTSRSSSGRVAIPSTKSVDPLLPPRSSSQPWLMPFCRKFNKGLCRDLRSLLAFIIHFLSVGLCYVWTRSCDVSRVIPDFLVFVHDGIFLVWLMLITALQIIIIL